MTNGKPKNSSMFLQLQRECYQWTNIYILIDTSQTMRTSLVTWKEKRFNNKALHKRDVFMKTPTS